ncbi:MAG: hypothetical protein AAB903_03440 [Patescibacteria group bacterium]
MSLIAKISRFFDKLEDRVRSWLSHQPILYALIGGIGIVLFWRGVWHTADYLMGIGPALLAGQSWDAIEPGPWWDGPLSLLISIVILLTVGLFVSAFIGDSLILSGLKKDKKLVEKTEMEVHTEEEVLATIQADIAELERDMAGMKRVEQIHHEK